MHAAAIESRPAGVFAVKNRPRGAHPVKMAVIWPRHAPKRVVGHQDLCLKLCQIRHKCKTFFSVSCFMVVYWFGAITDHNNRVGRRASFMWS